MENSEVRTDTPTYTVPYSYSVLIMSFQVQRGQILSPPYPFSGTLDIQQTQILERLKQLRVWQTQQQDHLLKQQQLKLQTEQEVITSNTDVNKQNKNAKQRKEILQQMVGALVSDNAGPFSPQLAVPLSGNLQPQGHTTSGSSLHSTDSGMLTGQSSAVDVKDKLTNNNVDHYDDSSGILTPESHGYSDTEEQPPLVSHMTHPLLNNVLYYLVTRGVTNFSLSSLSSQFCLFY